MALEFDDHARERMVDRGVTEEDVTWALRRRIGAPEPGQPGSVWIRGHASGNRVLKVCVRSSDFNYVITVAWA